MALREKLRNAWNAFAKAPPDYTSEGPITLTPSIASGSPTRTSPFRFSNERSIISSIYTCMSNDVAGLPIRHISLDDKGRYRADVVSGLNTCLTMEPNLDQGPRQFRQDIAQTLFDRGVAAIIPVDTSVEPNETGKYDIFSLRVGEIVAWHAQHVRVSAYNEKKGIREEVLLEKRDVAIVENPFYAVMNEPSSTLQRLIRKLGLLDTIDEASSSGKLDIIIQLPYVVKTEQRRQQAQQRRDDIEFQLRGSQYGIAYADATEKITQLNRPAENNLLTQIEFLTRQLYTQLGLTEDVMSGTAAEEVMNNYYNRTIEPILDAIVEAMQRSFLGRAAFAGKERVAYFRNQFRFASMKDLAEIGDKFTRNEILTSNEMRQLMGIPPSDDPKADELRNSNMPRDNTELEPVA